jgi:hypothetical protein
LVVTEAHAKYPCLERIKKQQSELSDKVGACIVNLLEIPKIEFYQYDFFDLHKTLGILVC